MTNKFLAASISLLDSTRSNWSSLLILSTVLLFSTKTLFNLPICIMALIGAYRLICNRFPRAPELNFIYILFFSIWLPMLFSLADAIDLKHSLRVTIPYLRFIFAAYFIAAELKKENVRASIIIGLIIIIGFWCFDALFQFLVGVDIFGYPLNNGFVGGPFSPKNTLGHVLAVFSPIFFELVRRHQSNYRFLWLLLVVFFSVVLLGGKRTAWIMLFSASFIYCVYLFFLHKSSTLKPLLIIVPFITFILFLFIALYQPLNTRVNNTLGLFSGNYEQINQASALRLPIWEVGINIYRAHWVNGIGPRGFRHAYKKYTNADNFYVNNERSSPTHPHLALLEILIETGSLGFIGFLIFWIYLLRLIFHTIKNGNAQQLPWLMCIMIAVLPYHTGLAFYGSYWSTITWWTVLISVCFVFSNKNYSS